MFAERVLERQVGAAPLLEAFDDQRARQPERPARELARPRGLHDEAAFRDVTATDFVTGLGVDPSPGDADPASFRAAFGIGGRVRYADDFPVAEW